MLLKHIDINDLKTNSDNDIPLQGSVPIIGIDRHRFLTDGEGVTTLVAFQGCPLDCKYCLNPQCKSYVKEYLNSKQLYDRVKIDDIYFLTTKGGITFGGGEPLLRSDFISEFREICGNKWSICVETSLNVGLIHVEKLLDIVDYWIIDIKDWNNAIYRNYTGKDNHLVKTNLMYLLEHGKAERIMVRVPDIPNFNTNEDIAKTVEELKTIGIINIDRFTYVEDSFSIRKEVDIKKLSDNEYNEGKFKCEVLKSIRQHVADYNKIEYKPTECSHKVCATGCCPVCDNELAWLTEEYYKKIY